MPRKLDTELTLDTLEDEVLFTIAALQADSDAAELVSSTEDWLSRIDAVRSQERSVRQAVATADARRVTANYRLDAAVVAFADELLLDVGKDRSSPRWLEFFKEIPSKFIKQALQDEVTAVQGWVTASSDPLLESHRSTLAACAADAQAALLDTAGLSSKRSSAKQARAALTEGLTSDRDALHRKLGERAKAANLSRQWADGFFRTA